MKRDYSSLESISWLMPILSCHPKRGEKKLNSNQLPPAANGESEAFFNSLPCAKTFLSFLFASWAFYCLWIQYLVNFSISRRIITKGSVLFPHYDALLGVGLKGEVAAQSQNPFSSIRSPQCKNPIKLPLTHWRERERGIYDPFGGCWWRPDQSKLSFLLVCLVIYIFFSLRATPEYNPGGN